MKAFAVHIFLIQVLIFFMSEINGQDTEKNSSGVTHGIVEGEDTIPMIILPEINIYNLHQYDYLYLKRRYRRLIYNVKRAYPYAKIAGIKLKTLDENLAALQTEKERKEYIKEAEQEMMKKFEKDVKRLTITQGIILVKLIDRETGRTSYEVIKELRGGFTAFFWQGIARLFGNNLKLQYDPEGADRVMEDVVQAIEAGFI